MWQIFDVPPLERTARLQGLQARKMQPSGRYRPPNGAMVAAIDDALLRELVDVATAAAPGTTGGVSR